MKKFVVKFVCFSVLVYMLAWGLDGLLCEGQKRVGGYPQQPWAEIRNGGIDADVIVMGNSRALEHFDPAVLDSVTGMSWYNLGMGAYPINVELMKYRCYRAHNAKPKFVVCDINWITLAMGQILNGHQSEQFFPLIYEGSVRGELKDLGYSWKEMYLPLYRWFGYQKDIKRSLFAMAGKHYCDYASYKGHMPDPDPWDLSRLQITGSIEDEMNEEAMKLFEEFLTQCQEENVQVILVNSPMYEKAYQLQKNNEKNEAYMQDVAARYAAPYWKYNDGNPMWTDSTLFNAGVHLTPEGTKMYSRLMGEEFVNRLDNSNE